MQEVVHNWVFSSMSLGYCRCHVVELWVMSLGCRRYRRVAFCVVQLSSMSLGSRRHLWTLHVDGWLSLSLTGFAVNGLDCSSIR